MNARFLSNYGNRLFSLAIVVLITICTIVICICSALIVSSLSSASVLLHSKCSNKVDTSKLVPIVQNLSCIEEGIINEARMRNAFEMNQFDYTNEINRLTLMTPETGGTPVRSMVLSTWRSGSSFLAGILGAVSGSYLHFEPLFHLSTDQIRTPGDLADKAIDTIHQLLNCNYTGLANLLSDNNPLNRNNVRLWPYCEAFHFLKMCNRPSFMGSFCGVFPFQVIKTVRLRVAVVEPLLSNPDLNIRIVFLLRDPRGIMSSRYTQKWCGEDCKNSTSLCQDMVSDLKAARYLRDKYPNALQIVRYEDLTLRVYEEVEHILQFLRLPFRVDVIRYLDVHTNGKRNTDVQVLNRDTKNAAFSWRQKLTFTEIEQVQLECSEALDSGGYRKVNSRDELQSDTFSTLLPFPHN